MKSLVVLVLVLLLRGGWQPPRHPVWVSCYDRRGHRVELIAFVPPKVQHREFCWSHGFSPSPRFNGNGVQAERVR
jgi:hypothetical protein